MRLTCTALALAAAATVPLSAEAQVQITGAGSTLAQPIYSKWADGAATDAGVRLNYQGIGSGAGQKLIFARTVDFGASDAPVAPAKLAEHKLLQFPTVIGAVDVVVNLPGIAADQLRLNSKLLAGIYLGSITNWNDPAIAAANPGLNLPDLPVAPVYRADGSGTTFVFTSYLTKVNEQFRATIGSATAVNWPAGTGAKGTAGVAGAVKNAEGAIGYVESSYATLNHLTTVQLQNHDGAYIKPTLEAFAASASASTWSEKSFAVDINDQPGALSWPIVSATYVLVPQDPADPAKNASIFKLFNWAFTSGDPLARGLQYIPLPAKVKDQVRAAWKTVPGGK